MFDRKESYIDTHILIYAYENMFYINYLYSSRYIFSLLGIYTTRYIFSAENIKFKHENINVMAEFITKIKRIILLTLDHTTRAYFQPTIKASEIYSMQVTMLNIF